MKNVGALKNVYTEQLNKLQQKHQQECDLLEDLRLFAKQRSIIEKEYAQSLSKLAQQFLSKRSFPLPPGVISDDGQEHRTMHEVWQTVLEETEKVGKVRLQAADIYLQQISEPCKPLRAMKSQVAKKVFENLVEVQKELSLSVQEVTKLQKTYKDEEHLAHDARVKAAEADDKVKRKSVGLFTSMSKLQQQSAKLNVRREGCEVKSTAARNDYILSLSAANAHVLHYYCKDTPELIKTLDGEVYEKAQEYFTLFCQAELHSCGVTQECFMKILADATKVSRDYNLQGFLHDNTVFTDLVQYQFQAQDNDPISKVSREHGCQAALETEAKKCASRIAKEDRVIRSAAKKLQQIQDQVSCANTKGPDVPAEGGSTTASTAVDPCVKMEELRHTIRKAETEKTKAEARMEALKVAGLPTDEYLTNAGAEAVTPEEEEDVSMATASASQPTRTSSVTSYPGKGSDSGINQSLSEYPSEEATLSSSSYGGGGIGSVAPNGSTYVNYQEDDECIDEAFELSTQVVSTNSVYAAAPSASYTSAPSASYTSAPGASYASVHTYPMQCLALYNFQASNVDELNFVEGEQLEIIGDGGIDGWIKARNTSGRIGLIPETYIQAIVDSTLNMSNAPSITYNATGQQDIVASYTPAEATDQQVVSTYSEADYEIQATLSQSAQLPLDGGIWVKALYDYYGTCDEELTFQEGQVIQILRKELHDNVDDGWWEGELNGKIGVFPSLVVEELEPRSKVTGSPLRPGPPEFAPPCLDQGAPQLEITHPTPTEEGGGLPMSEKLQGLAKHGVRHLNNNSSQGPNNAHACSCQQKTPPTQPLAVGLKTDLRS